MQSDDEFGTLSYTFYSILITQLIITIDAYGPTTPFKPVALNSTSRTTKPNSQSAAAAGPSSQPVTAQVGTKRKKKSPEPYDAEAQYGHTEDEEGGAIPGDAGTNGKTSLKGKGKARAEPPSKTSKKSGTPMQVTEVDEPVEDTDGYTTKKPASRPATFSKKKATTASRQPVNSDGELGKLRQKLLDVRIRLAT